MSYVRWSTVVRDDCKDCGDTGYVSSGERRPFHRKLCRACTSCWYIYEHVDGYLALHHAGCTGEAPNQDWQLSYENAADWKPPEDCHMPDVALSCIKEALEDRERGGPHR